MKCNIAFPSFFTSVISLFLMLTLACGDRKQKGEEHKFTNALIDETSPYLLQHAHNPVNWRPWSQDALKAAEKENKLVLVSIGYSSCHWCHVMEEETFENEEVAQMMNQNFISIKVDREERPDVDQVYMTALRLLKDDVGWPLNVITLPNGKPIYGGTYHTREQWIAVLNKVSTMYREDAQKANAYADMLARGIQEVYEIKPASETEDINAGVLEESITSQKAKWDLEEGGTKGRQKFMLPARLDFLLDYAGVNNDTAAREFVKTTLDKMALGGIYDHAGGGFYRYSTDRYWKVPHFEKMLYDNAQLIGLYSKAYTIFKEPAYRSIVLETVSFLNREMKNPEGGYYAAMDADSEGEEGKYYIWKEEELKSILGSDFNLFSAYYNIVPSSAWENGNYVLHKRIDDIDFAQQNKLTSTEMEEMKRVWKSKLLSERGSRVKPDIDDKIITSWNALLIDGLVEAYKALNDPSLLEAAEAIYQFIEDNSYKAGALVHTYKENSTQFDGFLEDYVFLEAAALSLYSATLNPEYLVDARELNQEVESRFADPATGMYKYREHNSLIAKIIKTDDGPVPSPNAVMAHNLLRLGHIDYHMEYIDKAGKMLSSLLPDIREYSDNYAKWTKLFMHLSYPYYEIAVVGAKAPQLMADLHQRHLPNTIIVGSEVKSDVSLFENRFVAGQTFIYVCQNSTCKLPVVSVSEALEQMRNF